MSTPAEIESTATVLPPDVLDESTRARLRDAVRRDDPVVDARRWSRTAFLVMTLVVWFPTMWSGSKAADLAVQQWAAGIALTIGLHLVLATTNRFAKENARAVLRRDSIARAIAAAEAFQEAQAKAEALRAEAKAEADRRAAEQKEAQDKLREEQEAAAALADLMARSQKARDPAA